MLEAIEIKLFSSLSDGKYDNDVIRSSMILIDMASVYVDELDTFQVESLDYAKEFWEKGGTHEMRLGYLSVLRERMNKYLREGADQSRAAILNRFVAASLMRNDGLSYQFAEYFADLANEISFPMKKLDVIFSKHIPEYEVGCIE